jgi:acetyl esterase/lipase
MASRGWAVAALDYRLAPRFRFPAPLEDIVAAIDYLGRIGPERGFDGTRVVLLGRSSGGHLSLAAAYRYPDRVRGVAAFYAPTDLVWSWRRPAPRRLLDSNGVIEQFLGATPDGALDVFEAASPILDVTRNSPPTLLIHGAKDELVSPLQSTRLARVLDEAGAPHLHLELPWGCHGLDANLAGPSGQISTWLVERFLDFCNREQGSR